MALPKLVFVDTQVFEALNFNFSSRTMASFLGLCQAKGMTLVLPVSTEAEIKRHMLDRAVEAERILDKAIKDVHRKAEFMGSWPRYPKLPAGSDESRRDVVARHARAAWRDFLGGLSVKRLSYEGVNVPQLMHWYESKWAPFGPGGKSKEFPDAITLQILARHASSESAAIAVVSGDADFQGACRRFPLLLHFDTLSSFLELVLSEDERVDKCINALNAHMDDVNSNLFIQMAAEANFVHQNPLFFVDEAQLMEANIISFDVIGLGNHECTIAFEAEVRGRYRLEWTDVDMEGKETPGTESVYETARISGTTKTRLTKDYAAIEKIGYMQLDQRVVTVTKVPANLSH